MARDDEATDYDDGQYVVQVSEDQEPEVARKAGDVWLFPEAEEPLEASFFYRIGPMIEFDRKTLRPI